jgi:PPE-repeat protein
MLHIPSGKVSDNEAYEIAEHLQTYGSNCAVGTICQLPAQTLAFGGTGQFFGRLTHSNTANRAYVFPDATGKIPYFTGTPSGCAQWGTGGQIGGTNINCETILTGRMTTTAAARDVVTVTGATPLSHCSLTATNASAALHITGTYVSDYALNRITVTHAAVASMTYDLLCTPN